MKQLSVQDFLTKHPDFVFDKVHSLACARHIDEASEWFTQFCVDSLRPSVDPWTTHRERVRSMFGRFSLNEFIDFERNDYADQVPLLSREQLMAMVSRLPEDGEAWKRPTSGTTGLPFKSRYAPTFYFYYMLYSVPRVAWLTRRLEPRLLDRNVFCVSITSDRRLSPVVWDIPNGYHGLVLRPVLDTRSSAALDTFLHLMETFEPAVLALQPRTLEFFLHQTAPRVAAALGRLDMIVSSGSNLSPETRRAAQHRYGVSVFDCYGLSEVGVVASECSAQEGLHIFEHEVIVEVLADEGSIMRTGSGELLVTTLLNTAMPLVRYRTGDLGTITDEPCPCGLPGRRVARISGRIVKNLKLPDGSELSPTYFKDLQTLFGVQEFRITQRAPHDILVELEHSPGEKNFLLINAQVKKYMEAALGGEVFVKVISVNFSYDHKFERYLPMSPEK